MNNQVETCELSTDELDIVTGGTKSLQHEDTHASSSSNGASSTGGTPGSGGGWTDSRPPQQPWVGMVILN